MNINEVTLIGRITHHPVSKEFGEGKRFTKFTLATNHFVKGKKEKATEFHTIVSFGKLAELCRDLLTKGQLIYIQGRLKTSKWEDSNKVLHTSTDIVAQKMLLLERKQALVNEESSDSSETEAVVEMTPEMMAIAS